MPGLSFASANLVVLLNTKGLQVTMVPGIQRRIG
jgi:hypothetical protein